MYQWYKNDVAIDGATTPTLKIGSLQTSHAGAYKVRIANAAGVAESPNFTVVVDATSVAPVVLASPGSQVVAEGQAVTLRASAAGGNTLGYQWFKDGVAITGAKTANLAFSAASLADAGTYYVVISNSAGSVTTSSATLTVTPWRSPAPDGLVAKAASSVSASADGTLALVSQLTSTTAQSLLASQLTQDVTGDFDYRVKVDSLTSTSSLAEAGAIVEASLDLLGEACTLSVTNNGLLSLSRFAETGLRTQVAQGTGSAPRWLRFARSGSLLRGYQSSDGVTWSTLGAATTTLPSTTHVGTWVNSASKSLTASASFKNNILTTLPLPWSAAEVGSTSLVGSSYYENGTLVVTGGGSDIGGTYDQCRFVYVPATGDCEVVAKISAFSAPNPNSKAVVMMREALTGSSRCVAIGRTPTNKITTFARATAGATMSVKAPFVMVTPWVKIVRTGHVFKLYASADGRGWSLVSSQTVKMATSIYIGVATSSRDTTAHAQGFFQFVATKP